MKLLWTGTDSLMLTDYSMRKPKKKIYWFIFRILIRIIDPFIEEHYCISQNIADNVKKFGTKKKIIIVDTIVKHKIKYKKKKHKGFNVIYYKPKGIDKQFVDWLYGIDIIEKVKNHFPDINFIELDGTKDMRKIYPITDFMLRPNRHDGPSRMRIECDIQNIPYYWTEKNPNINDIIKTIKYELERQY